jgi:Kef-type K+ transport system membrane component KefB
VTFAALALVALVGMLGPLLALPQRWRVPVVLGELIAGLALGSTGTGTLHASNPTFEFLANVGFALVMFVAGTHVPVRDSALRPALRVGALRAAAIAVIAVPVALAISHGFGTGHTALYAVLLASSSAALILPVVDSIGLSGPSIVQLLPQVAIADAACIVALPLAIDPSRAGRSALGAVAVIACSGVAFLGLRHVERSGLRRRAHDVSERRGFALELRVSLAVLFGLAAVATRTHVSIMLAGFSLGIAVTAVGEPRRVAKQLFAITEGFLAPLFFVWLGASLNLRDLANHPSYLLLGVALGLGAVGCHAAMRLTGQSLDIGALAAAQLGVPVAAATLGTQLRLLRPGEPAALILGALVTIGVAILAAGAASRSLKQPSAASVRSARPDDG